MCCQEMGEKEATVALFCPKAAYDEPKVRKVRRGNWECYYYMADKYKVNQAVLSRIRISIKNMVSNPLFCHALSPNYMQKVIEKQVCTSRIAHS